MISVFYLIIATTNRKYHWIKNNINLEVLSIKITNLKRKQLHEQQVSNNDDDTEKLNTHK